MLQKLNFKPGFNKQDTESGAEGQWTDGDFVRFRYGLPEKIGGWNQLTAASKHYREQLENNMLLLLLQVKNIQLLEHHKVCFYIMVMIFLILHH